MKSAFVVALCFFTLSSVAQENDGHVHCLNNIEQERFLLEHPEFEDQIVQEQNDFQTFYELPPKM